LDSSNSQSTIKELDWVIQSLTENNIFDLKLKEEFISNSNIMDSEIIQFMSEYSSNVNKRQKFSDIETCSNLSSSKLKEIKVLTDCNYINYYY